MEKGGLSCMPSCNLLLCAVLSLNYIVVNKHTPENACKGITVYNRMALNNLYIID